MTRRLIFLMGALAGAQRLAGQSPEQRAVDYLAQEVPRWSRENGCFSFSPPGFECYHIRYE
jgi:hypothetical protein